MVRKIAAENAVPPVEYWMVEKSALSRAEKKSDVDLSNAVVAAASTGAPAGLGALAAHSMDAIGARSSAKQKAPPLFAPKSGAFKS